MKELKNTKKRHLVLIFFIAFFVYDLISNPVESANAFRKGMQWGFDLLTNNSDSFNFVQNDEKKTK